MITRDEIWRSVYGAWQLFLDRPDARSYFDTSLDGFWRSFQAIILIAPLYAIIEFVTFSNFGLLDVGAGIGGEAYFWARTLSLVVDWIGLPIVLAALSGPLGIGRTYASFIVVRNWAAVLMVLPQAALAAVQAALGLSLAFTALISLFILAAILRLAYLNARRIMEAAIGLAIGVVALDFFLSLFIRSAVNLLFGLPAEA